MATRTRSSTARLWLVGAVVAVLVVAIVVVANRTGGSGSAEIDHVHGLGVNPADGTLYVATHNGVFRLPADGAASRVGDGAQDTMGFAVVGPDRFLASGHPAPLQGGPDHLGLIESTDAGVSWSTLSLAGEADFHALQHVHDTTYGYDSVTGQFMASPDGLTWDRRSTLDLGFAVSPIDPDLVLAGTETGLVRSTDGGRTWAPAGGPPVVLLAWPDAEALWGITATGELHRSADSGGRWSSEGTAPGSPTRVHRRWRPRVRRGPGRRHPRQPRCRRVLGPALPMNQQTLRPARLVLAALALAGGFVFGVHTLAGERQLEVFALFLALTACVYGGAALTPAGVEHGRVEAPVVLGVFAASVAGLVVSPLWVAVGYLAHGAWDLLHRNRTVRTPVVSWFPLVCGVFDAVVGLSVIAWWALEY